MIPRKKPLLRSAYSIKRSPIRRVSKKRAGLLRIYSVKRRSFLENHPNCEIGRDCCTGRSQDVHHAKGRGPYLNEEKTWLAVCRCCHDWTHSNPGLARTLGFLQ